jgi:hypothetical protein
MPHLRLSGVAVTGGFGIDLGLAAIGHSGTRDRITDLDLVVAELDAVAESVVGPFLVSHYHRVRPGVPKFMVQLVEPVSRIRVDVFPDLVGAIGEAWTASIGTHSLPVLPLTRILDHKIQTLSCASASTPIDPKHVHDAQMLGAVLHRRIPTVAREALVPDVYGLDEHLGCQRCELSRDVNWPLAHKDEICELLGWKGSA